ncbi:mechanosensitive ion channel family protein [Luteimonas sp. SJ-92]|uniref:Mechanosensing system component YbdG n=1 Tax=Luteimonas salinisoli TaxID=2752307 RepID=A0A853JDC3_9GAMM|nr:mechanosensitive ion channel family protein [Luteimonas salinisoli]NZA27306.1 mechanosensitive ion channel family protein [Luteimonas salinisoli]
MQRFSDSIPGLAGVPHADTLLALLLLIVVAALASWLTQRVLLRIVRRVVQASPMQWDDALLARGVLSRLAHVVPALVISFGISAVPDLPEAAVLVVRNVARSYVILTVALSLGNLFNALGDLYARNADRARTRPIKGYLQVAKLVVFLLAAVLAIAALIDRSPLILLSGLGAMTAVLLLVFKDTILSLVASVQLASNDMLRVGDWIEMPELGADGDVIDIALNTVKVQNWDKTVTTIPTYRLISDSFKNWRGMSESGGRRIKRPLLIDQSSVRFLAPGERDALRRIALIDDYLDAKRRELEEWNAQLAAAGKDPVNTRRVTNLGTFRAYVAAYLRAHPQIRQDMTLMVRQLQPDAHGIPLEVYCFTATTEWAAYEGIQADIFDHLLAVLPEFGLRLFQSPSGADVTGALARLDEGRGAADAAS